MATNQYWFRRNPRQALLLILTLGLVFVLIALELGARIFFAEWGPAVGGERVTFCEYDDLLGWVHRPNMTASMTRREFSVQVKINSNRLRDHEYPIDRNDKNRMLVLGDSFGWGLGVQRTERFDGVLERRHRNWEIINTSVSGYGTDQQYLYLKESGMAYKPDVVLLLFYANDFANNNAAVQYFRYKPYFVLHDTGIELRNNPVPTVTILQRIAHFVSTTYVYGRAYLGAKRLFSSLSRNLDALEHDDAPKNEYHLTKQLIKEIHSLSRANGAIFILVSIPMNNERTAALRALSEESDFPYLALDHHFERAGDDLTFPLDGHWNTRGHRAAADAIEHFLQGIGLFLATATPTRNTTLE